MTLAMTVGVAIAFAGALLLAGYCLHVLREARRSRALLRANIERLVMRTNVAALADRDRARRLADRADPTQEHPGTVTAVVPISAPRRG